MMRKPTALLLIFQLVSICLAQDRLPSPPPPQKTISEGQKIQARRSSEQSDEADVVKITTNLVQIDAVVTDKNGQRIKDLRPEELEMFEDGKSQKITHFSYIALDSKPREDDAAPARALDKSAPPLPPVKLKPEEVRRTIALVVDDLGLSFESAYYVRRSLKKFVDEQIQPNDLVAIIRTGGGIGALQQFTSDKRQLYAAVEKVKWNPLGRGGVSPFEPMGSDLPRLNDEESGRTSEGDLDQFREDLFATGTLGALNYVVRGLHELPGRKSVVLFAEGFRIFSQADPMWNTRILFALRHLTDLANRASVVIYTIDPRGLQTLGLTAADSTRGLSPQDVEQQLSTRRRNFFDSQDGLSYLSDRTGGITIKNTNDIFGGLKRVIADQEGYYLIGFRPDDSTFDLVNGRAKFHHISLKIKRSGKYNVRMRNGFYGVSDDDSAMAAKQTPKQEILRALISPFASSGIHLRLTSLFINNAQGSAMHSLLHVDPHDFDFSTETDGSHKAVLDIVAVTFGDNGQLIEEFNYTQTIHIKDENFSKVINNGFTYTMTVPIKKPGAYQLRTALRDSLSGRVGSASQFIEVPDIKKNKLLLSGVLVRGLPLEAYLKGIGSKSGEQNANDISADALPNASSAVRQFRTGMVLVYGFAIYNAQIDKLTGKPKLKIQARLFRNGKQLFDGKEIAYDPSDQIDLKRLTAGGGIQLGTSMNPGEYVLQLVVTDMAKEKPRVATQWVDFEIVP